MSMDLFRDGGSHRVRKTGSSTYEFSISLPKDQDGRTARECPSAECSPGFFKVKPGTGIQNQTEAFCPYCRTRGEPSDFTTQEQVRYARQIVEAQAHEGVERMMREALGLDSRGRRQLVGGLLNVSLEMKPSSKPHVWQPWETILKRDVVCPRCTLDQSVYGLAVWCADCGADILSTHVLGEIGVVRAMLADVERRRELLGERAAAKDLENALEDLVSVFEAAVKIDLQRFMRLNGVSGPELETKMRRIGSRLQSVSQAQAIVADHCSGAQLFGDTSVLQKLDSVFQKRHPITHNLGVIDRKYLDRVRTGEIEGREVLVRQSEVEQAANTVFLVFEDLHLRLFTESVRAVPLPGNQGIAKAEVA